MNNKTIKPLGRKRFNALVGQSRSPAAAFFCKEIGWFTNHDESVIGVLTFDIIDHDFSALILGRDEIGRYCCFDQKVSIDTPRNAYAWLKNKIEEVTLSGEKTFPQGEDGGLALDIFTPVSSDDKLHPYFKILSSQPSHSAARGIIREMMPHYVDIDGNFVEQFQTTGFDARVWELYLNAYLTEEGLFFNRQYNAPDFIVQKHGHTIAIEATIVGRKTPLTDLNINEVIDLTMKEIFEKSKDEMPIRFGSPLYSKLKKEYWKLEHVAGHPLVIAIADFHEKQSMLWTSTSLINYLYGVRHDFHHDENDNLIISPQKIEKHKVGKKEIPSGFFFQPNAENISAVMFSASGTISKFNRIGKQAGFGQEDVKMFRQGTFHDHDPHAFMPKIFYYEVNEECEETWAEGMNMYHNPNALHPVPEELFPSIAHHHFKDEMIVSTLPEFHVYSSMTQILNIVSDTEQNKKEV